jgi:hypothetical protein
MPTKTVTRPSPTGPFIRRASLTGAVSGLLMSTVIAGASRLATGRSASGLNVISHMLWGRRVSRKTQWTLRHTGTGLALNQLACLFWAGCYEAMLGDDRRTKRSRQAIDAIALSAVAYLVDYHLVPERFTPGFELTFSRRWFPVLYAGLAGSLWLGAQCHRPFRLAIPPSRNDFPHVTVKACGAA